MSAPVITQYGSASQYIGSPVVYQIVPTGAGVNGTFYRVKLKVVACLGNNDSEEFDFPNPVVVKNVNQVPTAQNMLFDISSALIAVAEQWEPTAVPSTYPAVTFYMVAKEEWMIDGTTHTSDAARFPGSTGTVVMYMGKLTDWERITGNRPSRYSRKPSSSPEICFLDYQVIVPGSTSAAPDVSLYLAGDPGEQDFEGLNYYVIPAPRDGYEIRFINSLGVHENVFVYGLPKKDAPINTTQNIIARQETLTKFSRGITAKSNDHEIWQLTSGPLDEQWASWFVHEFLMAQWHWIKINGQWLSCHVLPEDTTALIDRITPARNEVHFKLKLDINGSPIL